MPVCATSSPAQEELRHEAWKYYLYYQQLTLMVRLRDEVLEAENQNLAGYLEGDDAEVDALLQDMLAVMETDQAVPEDDEEQDGGGDEPKRPDVN